MGSGGLNCVPGGLDNPARTMPPMDVTCQISGLVGFFSGHARTERWLPGTARSSESTAMRFKCACGFVIVDNGAVEHHMGRILREQDREIYHDLATRDVVDFIKAIQAGKRREWIAEFYAQPDFDLDDTSVVFDIWTRRDPTMMLDIYQCDACGRVYIEREPHTFRYRCFKPEHEDWRGALAVQLPPEAASATVPSKPKPRPWWKFW